MAVLIDFTKPAKYGEPADTGMYTRAIDEAGQPKGFTFFRETESLTLNTPRTLAQWPDDSWADNFKLHGTPYIPAGCAVGIDPASANFVPVGANSGIPPFGIVRRSVLLGFPITAVKFGRIDGFNWQDNAGYGAKVFLAGNGNFVDEGDADATTPYLGEILPHLSNELMELNVHEQKKGVVINLRPAKVFMIEVGLYTPGGAA